MGRGPRLLDGGWEHRGAGTPVFLWLGRRSSGHPWPRTVRVRLPGWRNCAGEEPNAPCFVPGQPLPGLPGALHVPVAMAAGGSIVPMGLGWGKRGEHPACPLHSRAGLSLAAAGERGSGFTRWHGVAGDAASGSGSSPAFSSPELRPPVRQDGGPSLRSRHHEGAPSEGRGWEPPAAHSTGWRWAAPFPPKPWPKIRPCLALAVWGSALKRRENPETSAWL